MGEAERTEILHALDEVRRVQAEYIASNTQEHQEMRELQNQVQKSLYGNGDTGITERVRNLEGFVIAVESWGKWLKVGVAGLVLKFAWDILTVANG